jgi:DHA1 family bicyclomycin/chloramphenicol resistance-like MFS transporter
MSTRLVPFLVTAFIVAAETAISFNSVLLPNLQADFAVSSAVVQMTIAVGLFALGISGVIYGGLSDCLGRRPVILGSISLFALASLACAIAPNVQVLLMARFFQGMGSGAGWVVGNACLKDLFQKKDYVRVMNQVHAAAGVTPAVAPVLGSVLATWMGWRSCFVVLSIMSALACLAIARWQPETLVQRQSISWHRMAHQYVRLLSNRRYVSYTAVKAVAVMLLFCEVSNAPLVFIRHMGVTELMYSGYIGVMFACYVSATLMASRLQQWLHPNVLIMLGLSFIVVANFVMALGMVQSSVVMTQVDRGFCFIGWGLVFGNATACVVSSAANSAGAASAAMIATEMLLSAFGIYFLSIFFNGTMQPLAIFATVFGCVALLIMIRIIKRKD